MTAVLRSHGGTPLALTLFQDASTLTDDQRGRDTVRAADGSCTVMVDTPRLYHLVRNREFGEHILRLTCASPGVEVFSFGFLGGTIGELVQENRHDARG